MPPVISDVVRKPQDQVSNGTGQGPGVSQVSPQTPSVPTTQTSTPEPSQLSATDILKRSGELKGQPRQTSPQDISIDELKHLSKADLDKIKDPIARQIVENKWNLLEQGFNKKFQELAVIRKEAESKVNQPPQAWTPERLQSELGRQDFMSSIQYLQGQASPQGWSGTTEEWSSLNDTEKKEFMALRQDNNQVKTQLNHILSSQEHEKLTQRYPEYNPTHVDGLIQELSSGKYQLTREDIWRAASYEDAVKSAYQLGLQDNKTKREERINGSTMLDGSNMKPADSLPQDVNKKNFVDIARYRLNEIMKSKQRT